jgi:hypothetical protein
MRILTSKKDFKNAILLEKFWIHPKTEKFPIEPLSPSTQPRSTPPRSGTLTIIGGPTLTHMITWSL